MPARSRGCGRRIASHGGDFYPDDVTRHFQKVEGIADRAVGEFLRREPVTVGADVLWVRRHRVRHRVDELVVVNGAGGFAGFDAVAFGVRAAGKNVFA